MKEKLTTVDGEGGEREGKRRGRAKMSVSNVGGGGHQVGPRDELGEKKKDSDSGENRVLKSR